MSELEEELKEVQGKRKNISKELQALEESEVVKRYLTLQEQREKIYKEENDLYRKLRIEQFDLCDHILVYTETVSEDYGGHTYRRKGCMKCGLNENVRDRDISTLSEDQKIMLSYLQGLSFGIEKGIDTELTCNLDLAISIYSKIKEAKPDIDDELAAKYFKVALEDIRNKETSDERKEDRTKKMSLW